MNIEYRHSGEILLEHLRERIGMFGWDEAGVQLYADGILMGMPMDENNGVEVRSFKGGQTSVSRRVWNGLPVATKAEWDAQAENSTGGRKLLLDVLNEWFGNPAVVERLAQAIISTWPKINAKTRVVVMDLSLAARIATPGGLNMLEADNHTFIIIDREVDYTVTAAYFSERDTLAIKTLRQQTLS